MAKKEDKSKSQEDKPKAELSPKEKSPKMKPEPAAEEPKSSSKSPQSGSAEPEIGITHHTLIGKSKTHADILLLDYSIREDIAKLQAKLKAQGFDLAKYQAELVQLNAQLVRLQKR